MKTIGRFIALKVENSVFSRFNYSQLYLILLTFVSLNTTLFCATAIAQTCIQPPSGMVSWWPGDGNANDIWSTNHGFLVSGATFSSGMVGQAFSLDGVDDFVDFGVNVGNFGTNNFTVDLWVSFRSLSGEQVIIEKYIETFVPGTRTGWGITKLGNNMLRLYSSHTHPLGNLIPDLIISIIPNTWHHIAITRSGDFFTVFWDGSPVGSGSNVVNLNTTASLKIGHRGNPTDTPGSFDTRGFYLNGLIDEVEILNRALSPSEIQAIFNAGSAGKCKVVEDCTNGIDDDGDELVDCDDPDCSGYEGCVCSCPTDDCLKGCISGRVEDADTGQPLAGKLVKLNRLSPKGSGMTLMNVVTDTGGCYSFSNLDDGTYLITVKGCKGGGKKVVVISAGSKEEGKNFQCK